MFVEGLTTSINESSAAKVVSVSYTLADCLLALSSDKIDVLLLDISMPDGNGIDFCKQVHLKYPDLNILILTTHDELSIAKRVMANGALGYILKNSLSEEVIEGIKAVARGETFFCDKIDILMKKHTDQPIWLSSREKELLRLIVNGYTNQEISEKLFLSIETIKFYRKNLIQKLGARNSMILVKMAIEKKLV